MHNFCTSKEMNPRVITSMLCARQKKYSCANQTAQKLAQACVSGSWGRAGKQKHQARLVFSLFFQIPLECLGCKRSEICLSVPFLSPPRDNGENGVICRVTANNGYFAQRTKIMAAERVPGPPMLYGRAQKWSTVACCTLFPCHFTSRWQQVPQQNKKP